MSAPSAPAAAEATMTSKDYYFDSYAHFGKCFSWSTTKETYQLI